jgi:hypothetical protein
MEKKINRMDVSLQHLLWYAAGEDMLNRIVTGDKSWVHHHQPKSKRASVQWKHPSSPSTKKFQVTPSAGKVMLTVFWDSQGGLFAHFWKHGERVNSALDCEVLLKLQDAIHRKLPGQLVRGYCFIMTVPDPIQPEQPRRELKNYSGSFLNIHFTAWNWPLVTSICLVC